jgi:hypothetical protein
LAGRRFPARPVRGARMRTLTRRATTLAGFAADWVRPRTGVAQTAVREREVVVASSRRRVAVRTRRRRDARYARASAARSCKRSRASRSSRDAQHGARTPSAVREPTPGLMPLPPGHDPRRSGSTNVRCESRSRATTRCCLSLTRGTCETTAAELRRVWLPASAGPVRRPECRRLVNRREARVTLPHPAGLTCLTWGLGELTSDSSPGVLPSRQDRIKSTVAGRPSPTRRPPRGRSRRAGGCGVGGDAACTRPAGIPLRSRRTPCRRHRLC